MNSASEVAIVVCAFFLGTWLFRRMQGSRGKK